MSENVRMLGEYSAAMARGDTEAVYACFSPDFVSHVADRVNPGVVGTDIRGLGGEVVEPGSSRLPRHDLHRQPPG